MIIYVDIDETICYYDDPNNREYTLAKPHVERIQKINNLYDGGNTIVYWTARGTKTGLKWFHVTMSQLTQWKCKYHELKMGKPNYDLFIDDKNIHSEAFFSQ